MLKKEVRIIAWDDCAFRFKQKKVQLIGAIFRGGQFLDGLLSTTITKDGTDATEKIAKAIKQTRHYDQLSYVMTNGITFAGFNLVDIRKLNRETGLPVIAVQRQKVNMEKFLLAMKRVKNYEKRADIVKQAGKIYSFGGIFYQRSGLNISECEQLLRTTTTHANIPEPLRAAHLIASGLSRHMKDAQSASNISRNIMFESRGGA